MSKNVLITGGGTGIGKAIAKSLIQLGYNVCVSYLSSDEGAREVLAFAKEHGVEAYMYKADVSQCSQITELFNYCESVFEHLDLFVNNAGITKKSNFLDTDEALFDTICNLDLKGTFFCCQSAAKLMIKQNVKGNIVVISSNNCDIQLPKVSVYGTIKTAVVKLVKHIAVELAQYGIRVNTISPGWTDTGCARMGCKEDTYDTIPLHRWVDPDSIGKMVAFLDSEASASITGSNFVVDGGASIQSASQEKYLG